MSTKIHPMACVESGAQLGQDVEIGPFCHVGPEVVLGDRVRLISHVSVAGKTSVGADTQIWPHASLGHWPQDLKHRGGAVSLHVGERNIIRENVTMHCGTLAGRGYTKVGSDGMFMVGSHIAHDCIIGDKVVLANNVQVGGHVECGDFVWMGALAGVHQFTRIGRHAFIGAMATVTKDVIPYGFVVGDHAHLNGFNVVGLKRRGFTRESIHTLRSAYRMLFADEGTFQERVTDVSEAYRDNAEVAEIVAFIQVDAERSLCMPRE